MTTADLSKKPEAVSAMFDDVAAGYDVTNNLLSAGNAVLWRIATTRAVNPQADERVLDLAAGTGTSSVALAKSGAHVVAADFSPGMLEVGRKKHGQNPLLEFVEADATKLPFADNSFDAVTMSFGLRNVVEPKRALAELYRVTKPGGRIVICEFSTPPVAPIRAGYNFYLRKVMPVVAKFSSTNTEAYTYLADSIADWPNQATLATWIREAGFMNVAYRNLTAGVVALHRGIKPVE
ncbi:bifunctional demethylmenaquinone methyltransferase/2-methoxy-6-polyprenyl-1,4-benzoquinol methylase UbiE [Aurantimicrobium minutum]|uniref:bifunctional demethylmenaquinone methyltransferase/2-methoxy-6-polyprenyl-1,4-benzoquinol methylase UbiE n=1 Tax=Aurantimicrobium minutum TaxID=708131 RepID=UPI002473837E|nr:bifunctional demethylmenaquinone methyltransferase/2-methoxy-6-polyprenyl-1,4-benzoquinol methylase UbiE [Aurantimicrobium minutum]MDH6423333.1 demethylmenaquinone methyltransferase/2-methoxy-6-polyprenyl-1,4-benzoquinol methylase [Aurantimicrobium minutum]